MNARKEWLQNLCDTEKFHHSILSNVEIRELIKNYFTEVRSNFATWVRKHGLVLLEPGINLDLFPPYRISSKELTTKQRNEEIEKGRNNWKTYFSTLNVSKKDTFNAARWIILESGQEEYKRTPSNIAYCAAVIDALSQGLHMQPSSSKEIYMKYLGKANQQLVQEREDDNQSDDERGGNSGDDGNVSDDFTA